MSRMSMMWKAAGAAALLSVASQSAHAQSSSLTAAQAMAALQAVQAYAKNDGSDPSLAVIDRDGNTVLLLKGNGAGPHNIGLAQRKAFTANQFKMRSIDWRDRTMPGKPNADERNTPNAVPLGGGVPIMVGNDIVGAVGVSGTRGGQEGDTAGAQAGADAAAAAAAQRPLAQN
jgi:uncharacterized protein GlcG (DUF336 family)